MHISNILTRRSKTEGKFQVSIRRARRNVYVYMYNSIDSLIDNRELRAICVTTYRPKG